MTYISHSKAFAAQADFPVEAKIKVGKDIWTPGTAGSRLFAEVLAKAPRTIGEAIDRASKLKESPFTPKAAMAHMRWIYTAGELEVDGTSYVVQAKPKADPKPPKVEAPKVEAPKPAPKAKPKSKVAASRKPSLVRTQRAT